MFIDKILFYYCGNYTAADCQCIPIFYVENILSQLPKVFQGDKVKIKYDM